MAAFCRTDDFRYILPVWSTTRTPCNLSVGLCFTNEPTWRQVHAFKQHSGVGRGNDRQQATQLDIVVYRWIRAQWAESSTCVVWSLNTYVYRQQLNELFHVVITDLHRKPAGNPFDGKECVGYPLYGRVGERYGKRSACRVGNWLYSRTALFSWRLLSEGSVGRFRLGVISLVKQ